MKIKTLVVGFLSGSLLLTAGPLLHAQTQLIPTSPSGFTFSGGSLGTGSVVSVTPPSGASFTQAWQVTVTHVDSYHDVRVYAATSASVTAGDALVATVWYRRIDGQIPTGLPGSPTLQPNESNLYANFNQTTGTVTAGSLEYGMRGRLQWRQINVPFIAVQTGTATFEIDCAAALQEVQFGGMSLVDYGQKSVLSKTKPVDDTSAFVISNNNGTWGTLSTNYSTAGTLNFFTNADQVNVTTAAGYADAQECNINANATGTITSGDTLVAFFTMARDSTSNQSNMALSGYNLTLESNSTSIPSSYAPLVVNGAVNGSWQTYCIPFTASQTYTEAGSTTTAQFQLFFGAAIQKVDIGGIQLVDLGPSVSVASLTSNQNTYPGRSLNDQNWRTTAAANIQKYRMGNLTVNVLNDTGGAIPNVTVTANMTKPEFKFGSWANWGYITGNPAGGQNIIPNYQAVFSQYAGTAPSTNSVFNMFEDGDYKWPIWEQTTNSPAGLWALNQWFQTNGITDIRGHNLVWPNYLNKSGTNYIDVPNDVPTLGAAALTNRIINHIISEAGDMTNGAQVCSLIHDWDVVNEPWTSRSCQAVLSGFATNNLGAVTPSVSAAVIKSWLNEAALCDPSATVFINDDGAEETFARNLPESATSSVEEYDYELTTNVIHDGGIIDGFGFESHFSANNPPTPPTDPISENAIWTRFGSLTSSTGPLITHVTEYDPQFTDQSEQADYMADYLTLAFSQTNVDSFVLYGFWGGDFSTANNTTVPGTTNHYGNVFNSDWSISPSGEAYLGLVHGQWWTRNASATSNTSGVATINGFLGRYALTASSGDVTKIYYVDLPSPDGAVANVQLDGSGGTTHVWVYDVANSRSVYSRLERATNTNSVNGISVTSTNGSTAFIPPGETQGPQQLQINTEAYGTVYVWFRGNGPGYSNDCFYAGFDAPATNVVHMNVTAGFTWGEPWGATTLATGRAHVLNVDYDQTSAQLDQVLITDDPNFVPTY